MGVFSRKSRLVSKKDFQNLFSSAKKVSYKYFSLLYCANDQGSPRLAIMISKQVMKKAVDRNYARRVIRECFRIQLSELPAFDIVIMIRAAVPAHTQIRADVDQLFSKLKRIVAS